MTTTPAPPRWKKLDKDLMRVGQLEAASQFITRPLVAPGIGLAFVLFALMIAMLFMEQPPISLVVVAGAGIGAYMALNIGANDVANNMGPAVGSGALGMGAALAIAAVCETAGALLAGGDVVNTISSGIIDPASVAEPRVFVWAMMAALIASALWVNLATVIGAPVSTTHAVVGGVMGAGIAAAGFAAVNWPTMGRIAASWVISPLAGGLIAALVLAFIKVEIVYQKDRIAAARRWVPVLIAVMAAAFATYLGIKGLSRVVMLELGTASLIGLGVGVATWAATRPLIRRQSEGLDNRKRSLRVLFQLPLVFSAALLSFAHGANDVANAIGPLSAIADTVARGEVSGQVTIPAWVMAIGGFGIAFGLMLFGPKLIRLVGAEITKLNPMRAYCVALSAAVTVIVASWLGLPVSSTHIAVGAVFGVGFFREWDTERRKRAARALAAAEPAGAVPEKPVKVLGPEERRRRKLVRRTHFTTIIAAWVVTVPAAALLSAAIFLVLNRISL